MHNQYVVRTSYRDFDTSYDVVEIVSNNFFLDSLFEPENEMLRSLLLDKDIGHVDMFSGKLTSEDRICGAYLHLLSLEDFFKLSLPDQRSILQAVDVLTKPLGISDFKNVVSVLKVDASSPAIEAAKQYMQADKILTDLFSN